MQFFCKKKLKSEIFNNKKSFNIMEIFTEKLKNPVFRQAGMGGGGRGGGERGSQEKGVDLDSLQIEVGNLAKKREWCF